MTPTEWFNDLTPFEKQDFINYVHSHCPEEYKDHDIIPKEHFEIKGFLKVFDVFLADFERILSAYEHPSKKEFLLVSLRLREAWREDPDCNLYLPD